MTHISTCQSFTTPRIYRIDHIPSVGRFSARLAVRFRRSSVSVHAAHTAAVVLANDGQIPYDAIREAAGLVADAIQDATVVALRSADTFSTFEQLEVSAGSTIDAVRAALNHESILEESPLNFYMFTGALALGSFLGCVFFRVAVLFSWAES